MSDPVLETGCEAHGQSRIPHAFPDGRDIVRHAVQAKNAAPRVVGRIAGPRVTVARLPYTARVKYQRCLAQHETDAFGQRGGARSTGLLRETHRYVRVPDEAIRRFKTRKIFPGRAERQEILPG